jgi:glycogen operon protein
MWLRADGQEMTDQDWNSSWIRCFGIFLSGDVPDEINQKGLPLNDNSMILIMNSHYERIKFLVPNFLPISSWQIVLDTSNEDIEDPKPINVGESLDITGRSLIILSCPCKGNEG